MYEQLDFIESVQVLIQSLTCKNIDPADAQNEIMKMIQESYDYGYNDSRPPIYVTGVIVGFDWVYSATEF